MDRYFRGAWSDFGRLQAVIREKFLLARDNRKLEASLIQTSNKRLTMSLEQTEALIGEMLQKHGPALRLYAATWTGAGADDCLQQALIKLATKMPTPDDPVAWLYRVVRNQAISQYRSERRRRSREKEVGELRLFETHDRTVPESGIDHREIEKALAQIPNEQREVVVARIWGGLTFEQIAVACKCSSSAAHRRYKAGLEQIRAELKTKLTSY